MKNKLKLTTALVGSLVAVSAGSALAQNLTTYYDNGKDGTTVSGNMNFSYRDQKSSVNGVNGTQGMNGGLHGFGKEVQININNRGKLNNGWGYAAGFSIEVDGTENNSITNGTTGAAYNTTTSVPGQVSGMFSENNFIDVIIGNTTLTVSVDHIQNPDSNPTLMGAPSTYLRPYGGTNGIYPTTLNSPYESAGVGVIQNVPGFGSFSALYVPNRDELSSNKALWGNDNGNTSLATDYNGSYGSAYEVGFVGNLGVTGLTTSAWYNNSQKIKVAAPAGNLKSMKATASYAVPGTPISIAAEVAENGVEGTTASKGGKVNAASVGLAYALTKDFTVAGTYGRAGRSDASGGTYSSGVASVQDETIKIVSVGYSLGPVAVKGQYRKTANLGGQHDGSESDFLVWSGVNF